MSLNIKNDDVHRAVRELARELGVSQTSAVETAVRELDSLLADTRRTTRSRQIREAAKAAQEAFRDVDLRALEADLYDAETGLPR
ncbi:MAG: type II toxin-antitoxin system VapB family antitoxin [Micropruina sp.]